ERENFWDSVKDVKPKAPNISLSQNMTLYRGNREIRILFLGRGHTGGDVVVHLPREGILISGCLIHPYIIYMGDCYVLEWIETLEHLKSLEFDWIIPGHGEPFQDRSRIDYFQAYLRDFWERAKEQYKAGVSAEEAAKRIDMRDHAEHYPNIQSVGVSQVYTERAYELLDEGTER
ncbi:unnamed protein product, partial [marine sediment metagenome]